MEDCQLAIKGSTRCQKKDLDQLFIHVNAKTNDVEDSNAYNAARALNRQEFLQVLVRIAVMKYILSGRMDDTSDSLTTLLRDDLTFKLPRECAQDSNYFRMRYWCVYWL